MNECSRAYSDGPLQQLQSIMCGYKILKFTRIVSEVHHYVQYHITHSLSICPIVGIVQLLCHATAVLVFYTQ